MKTPTLLLTPVVALGFAALAAGCPNCSAETTREADWLFARGDHTHHPITGARVAQYAAAPPVEGLPDPRDTLSRYTRSQTNLRGVNGSSDTVYEVRSFGTARGGFEAQSERAFDASLEQLRALTPFRFNPWLFYGAAVGPGGVYGGVPGGYYGGAAPGGGFATGPVPAGGFPPFGVPTQPYGGAGPYLPPTYFGFPYGGVPYGYGPGYPARPGHGGPATAPMAPPATPPSGRPGPG